MCVVWGRETPPASVPEYRQVLCLFSSKWMIYNHYHRGSDRSSLAHGPSLSQQPAGPSAGSHGFDAFAAPASALGAESGPEHEDRDGPVPCTEYIDENHDELKLYTEAESHYEDSVKKREELADDVKADAGQTEFQLGTSIRLHWIPEQQADKGLAPMFKLDKETLRQRGFRIAQDGVLEREVNLPTPALATWVPVVPDGQAMAHLSWKRWLFLQCHTGLMGAHRNNDKTLQILKRQVWWKKHEE